MIRDTKKKTDATRSEGRESRESPRDRLRALRDKYIRSLPDAIGRIEAHWSRMLEDKSNRDEARSLHGMLHTLAGSAPSFGFSEVGEAARNAEILVRNLFDNADPPDSDAWERIEACLDALLAASITSRCEELARRRFEESVPDIPLISREPKLVFIVDDDVCLLQSLAVQIGCFGYEVRTFSKLADLEEGVAKTPPSAIIMDLVFPEGKIAGADAIAALQKDAMRHIPVIFISQRDDFTARLMSVRAGGDAYLTKPLHICSLLEKLDQLTGDREADPFRILIMDDDPELSRFYALTLEQYGMKTRVVNDPMQIIEHLVEFHPELILMDMYMDGCHGDELAKIIRQMEAYVSIPIVYLSAETRKDRQLRALRIGADDFLTKPIKPEHLISSVTIRAERMRIIRSFMEQDSLTGLLNHTKTKEQLDMAVLRARRSGGHFCFAMIDIDGFKSINDTHGHLTGDRVIVILSRLLQQRLRKTDVIGRYGGEEFAIILMDTSEDQAYRVMDEIRKSFEQIRHESDSGRFPVTFSCGIASYPRFRDSLSLNKEADRLLYEAKRNGRNRVIAWKNQEEGEEL
jgi:diguanylate cyclase (GGDEF)-like protein